MIDVKINISLKKKDVKYEIFHVHFVMEEKLLHIINVVLDFIKSKMNVKKVEIFLFVLNVISENVLHDLMECSLKTMMVLVMTTGVRCLK